MRHPTTLRVSIGLLLSLALPHARASAQDPDPDDAPSVLPAKASNGELESGEPAPESEHTPPEPEPVVETKSSTADPFATDVPMVHDTHAPRERGELPTDAEPSPPVRLRPANQHSKNYGLGMTITGSVMTAVGGTLLIIGTGFLASHANEDPDGLLYGLSGLVGASVFGAGAGISIPGWVLLGVGVHRRKQARSLASTTLAPTVLSGHGTITPGMAMAMRF